MARDDNDDMRVIKDDKGEKGSDRMCEKKLGLERREKERGIKESIPYHYKFIIKISFRNLQRDGGDRGHNGD